MQNAFRCPAQVNLWAFGLFYPTILERSDDKACAPMDKCEPPLVFHEELDHNGMKFRIGIRPTIEGYRASWSCARCGYIRDKLAEESIERAKFLAETDLCLDEHDCRL